MHIRLIKVAVSASKRINVAVSKLIPITKASSKKVYVKVVVQENVKTDQEITETEILRAKEKTSISFLALQKLGIGVV